MLAVSGTEPAIIGTVFRDANGNGVFSNSEGLAGVAVQLFRDDGDSLFETDGSDVQIGPDFVTLAGGIYEFDNLDADARYFVRQQAQTVSGNSLGLKVSPLTAPGVPGITIDSFSTSHNTSASPADPTPAESRIAAAEALGGERDIAAVWTTGSNSFDVEVSPFASDSLQISTGPGVNGLGTVVWDGIDTVDHQIAMGLNGVDLTTGGNTGFVVRLGAEPAGATLNLRIYNGNVGNFSEVSAPIPNTGGGTASEFLIIPFSGLVGAVTPFDVDAIRMTIDGGGAAADTGVSLFGTIGAKVVNFQNEARIDLTITKDDSVAIVNPLQQVNYTVRVTNLGPSDVIDANVVDNFPSSLTLVSYTTTTTGTVSGQSTSGTGNINDLVNMAAGSTLTYNVIATVAANASGQLVNTATVTAPSGVLDINVSNNSDTDIDTIQTTVDLQITKTDGLSTVRQGQQITYIIVVSNAGPSDILGAAVTDTFPNSLTNVTFTSSTTTGTVSGNTASGTGHINDLINISANSSVTYTVNATVSPTATGSISNTAIVSPPINVTDIDTDNNSAVDTDVVVPVADLSITKTDGQTQVTPGQVLTYTITVNNQGPSAVTGATVADTFPAGLTAVSFTSIAAGGATGNSATGTNAINDTVNLPNGGSIVYTVTATVANNAAGTIENTATVLSPNGVDDPTPINNTAVDTDTVQPLVDLSVTKTDGVTTAVPGQNVTYTIVVSNAGPSIATGATFTDTFPAALQNPTFTSIAAGGASGNTASGSGNLNQTLNLPVGASVTYTVSGTVSPNATVSLANTATVTAPTGAAETVTINNTATDTDTLNPTADLSVTKTNNVNSVVPGQSTTYVIVVSNAGPSTVAGAAFTDTFPANLQNVTFTSSALGGATGNTASGSENLNQTLTMPPNSSVTYNVTGTVSSSATGSLANTATVTAPSGVTEVNTSNNTATDTDPLNPQVDLAITKTDGQTTAVPGQALTYTIVVSNTGPSAVTGATVADTFPATLTNVTYTSTTLGGATGNTAAGSGNISNTVNMPVGSSITYTVTGTVSAAATGSIANTATVTPPAGVTDSNNVNNSATDTDTLTPRVDLSITKTNGVTQVTAGQSTTYTIVVSNAGPSSVTGATVVDTFPTGLTNVTFTSSAAGGATGNRASGTGNLNETLNLPVGSSVTYAITGTVAVSTTSPLANTATVTAPAGVTESNTVNNTATDSDTVLPAPASLTGSVYVDSNANGVRDASEPGIAGVVVTLAPQAGGNARTATTDASGNYSFTGLSPGAYNVTASTPTGFRDGSESLGTGSTSAQVSANDQFFIELASGNNATAFNFGELRSAISKRDLLASAFANTAAANA